VASVFRLGVHAEARYWQNWQLLSALLWLRENEEWEVVVHRIQNWRSQNMEHKGLGFLD